MRMTCFKSGLASLLIGGAISVMAGASAHAQSMTPMRGEITSFSDEFALKVYPRNPYPNRIRVEMHAYDQDFRPIEAFIQPASFYLGRGDVRSVLVLIGFDGEKEKRVRICTESIPLAGQQTQIKVRICGKFLARRLQ